jgi:3-carboxy-cis,cis-muconate cycloisomerase
MPSFVFGSRLYGEMFSTAQMNSLFSDEAMVQRYLDVEVALARVQARLGIIPEKAATAISDSADISRIDWQCLSRRTQIVGYPILPLVEQLSSWPAHDFGQYCHWGATTQDIMDTADVLQIKAAIALVEADLEAIADHLARLADEHKTTAMAGRTHLQHALPVTFGFKCAGWLSAIDRHQDRLNQLKPRLLVGEFAGAVGTLASLGVEGLAVQEALMAELELGVPSMTWHGARDNFAEATGVLALICASLGKIAYDVMLMMQTEVGEVFEPYVEGRGASSTMPQKRNPISSELILAAAKIVREQHSLMLDAIVQDHERATGQWHVEWVAVSTAFLSASGALSAAKELLSGLEVHEDTMRRNLDMSGGLIVAEAVMMGLAPILGRQVAHDAVYECCRESLKTGTQFLQALEDHAEISGIVEPGRLAELVNPENYLGAAPKMVENYLINRK